MSTAKEKAFEDAVIAAINKYRVLHGVPLLRLNSKLTEHAKNQAQVCVKTGDIVLSSNDYGESIFSIKNHIVDPEELVDKWYNEIDLYDFASPGLFSSDAGGFTQLIWKESSKVGVGTAYGDGWLYVVTNYFKAGNVVGDYLENVLPPIIPRHKTVPKEDGSSLIHKTKTTIEEMLPGEFLTSFVNSFGGNWFHNVTKYFKKGSVIGFFRQNVPIPPPIPKILYRGYQLNSVFQPIEEKSIDHGKTESVHHIMVSKSKQNDFADKVQVAKPLVNNVGTDLENISVLTPKQATVHSKIDYFTSTVEPLQSDFHHSRSDRNFFELTHKRTSTKPPDTITKQISKNKLTTQMTRITILTGPSLDEQTEQSTNPMQLRKSNSNQIRNNQLTSQGASIPTRTAQTLVERAEKLHTPIKLAESNIIKARNNQLITGRTSIPILTAPAIVEKLGNHLNQIEPFEINTNQLRTNHPRTQIDLPEINFNQIRKSNAITQGISIPIRSSQILAKRTEEFPTPMKLSEAKINQIRKKQPTSLRPSTPIDYDKEKPDQPQPPQLYQKPSQTLSNRDHILSDKPIEINFALMKLKEDVPQVFKYPIQAGLENRKKFKARKKAVSKPRFNINQARQEYRSSLHRNETVKLKLKGNQAASTIDIHNLIESSKPISALPNRIVVKAKHVLPPHSNLNATKFESKSGQNQQQFDEFSQPLKFYQGRPSQIKIKKLHNEPTYVDTNKHNTNKRNSARKSKGSNSQTKLFAPNIYSNIKVREHNASKF